MTVQPEKDYRNYPFMAWLVQRELGKRFTLGTEISYHGPEGPASPLDRPATLLDIGGYYKVHGEGFQLLYCYGHSVVGKNESYAYLGLYWTWPAKKAADIPDDPGEKSKPTGMAFSPIGSR